MSVLLWVHGVALRVQGAWAKQVGRPIMGI